MVSSALAPRRLGCAAHRVGVPQLRTGPGSWSSLLGGRGPAVLRGARQLPRHGGRLRAPGAPGAAGLGVPQLPLRHGAGPGAQRPGRGGARGGAGRVLRGSEALAKLSKAPCAADAWPCGRVSGSCGLCGAHVRLCAASKDVCGGERSLWVRKAVGLEKLWGSRGMAAQHCMNMYRELIVGPDFWCGY